MKMKNVFALFSLLGCLSFLITPNIVAKDRVLLERGTASGKYTYERKDYRNWDKSYGEEYNHNLSGDMLGVVYMHSFSFGLLLGGGYQRFTLKGESKEVKEGQSKHQEVTDDFSGGGPFGLVGYDLSITEKLSFLPHLRTGILNTVVYTRHTVETDADSKVHYSDKQKNYAETLIFGAAIPLFYEINKRFILGVMYQSILANTEINESTYDVKRKEYAATHRNNVKTSNALQLTLGYQF